jgi:hypothetical protein
MMNPITDNKRGKKKLQKLTGVDVEWENEKTEKKFFFILIFFKSPNSKKSLSPCS